MKLAFILNLHETTFDVTKRKIVRRISHYTFKWLCSLVLRKGFNILVIICLRLRVSTTPERCRTEKSAAIRRSRTAIRETGWIQVEYTVEFKEGPQLCPLSTGNCRPGKRILCVDFLAVRRFGVKKMLVSVWSN